MSASRTVQASEARLYIYIYIYIRVLQKMPKFESYDAHSSNSLPSSPSIHNKIFMQFVVGLVVAQGSLPLVLIYNGICPG